MNLAEIALRPGRDPTRAARTAFLTAQGPVSNAELQRAILAVVGGLHAAGVQPGDKILLRMTNSVELAVSLLAAIWLGAVPVLHNSQLGRGELEHIVALSDPRFVLLAARSGDDAALKDLRPDIPRLTVTDDGIVHSSGRRPIASAAAPTAFDAGRDAPVFIVFTSGTTGRPKGIVHAHRWLEALGDANRARVPPREDDVVLATGEWSFISALGHNVLFPLRNGTIGAVMEERASPERILQTIERDRVTLLHSVATLYRRILGTPGIERRFDVTSLRGANSTGEVLEDSVRKEWQERFGCPIWEHYGISEAQMVIGDGPGIEKRAGSTGKPWGARAVVLDENLRPLPPGETGTLAFGADYPGFFLGYLGDDELTRATVRDGYFLTSDLARMDGEGYVYILGRADDCFKSKGVLIAPRELEDAILGLGDFEEACVFPIPDREIGNRIGAAVVRRGNAARETTQESLAAALSGRIAPFKLPHHVLALEQLPKNANGKTQRSRVARIAIDRLASTAA
jgi:4-hydroxybenzoate-CoA ligase